MSTVVQPCARCGTRWAVHRRPMHWCPRCHGVLLSPATVDAPPEQRNYRWVAHPPGQRWPERRATPAPRPAGTPHYTEIPHWGLHDAAPQPPAPARRGRFAALTGQVTGLLLAATVVFVLAAAAELGRYLILIANRTHLVSVSLLALSDSSVYLTAGLSLLVALAAGVGAAGWLVRARRAAFEQRGEHDPRPAWTLLCGCLIPGVNLVWPGLFLTELADRRGDPRARRAVRIWWCAWAINGALVVAAQCWRFTSTLQAQANGVIFSCWTDLAAAAVAVLTLWTMRVLEGRNLRGRFPTLERWVPATVAEPVIEPVHRANAAVGDDDPAGSADRAAAEPDAASHPEQEEVGSK